MEGDSRRWGSSEARPVLTHTGRESKASLLEPRTAFEWVAAEIPFAAGTPEAQRGYVHGQGPTAIGSCLRPRDS